MIREFEIVNGELTGRERNFEDGFEPEITLAQFECPRCHNLTFGKFEPFVVKGIDRWCSMCGYSEYNETHAKNKNINLAVGFDTQIEPAWFKPELTD